MCKKHKYKTKVDAMMQLFWCKMSGRSESGYYYCKECNSYHLTHKKHSQAELNLSMSHLQQLLDNAKKTNWIDARIIPPNFKHDILSLYSESGNYVECIRPKMLFYEWEPYPHYYSMDGSEVDRNKILYYINIPRNPEKP